MQNTDKTPVKNQYGKFLLINTVNCCMNIIIFYIVNFFNTLHDFTNTNEPLFSTSLDMECCFLTVLYIHANLNKHIRSHTTQLLPAVDKLQYSEKS